MRILLKPNLDKPNAKACTREAVGLLSQNGFSLLMEAEMKPFFGDCPDISFGEPSRQMEQCDICVAIGGDGTIIHAAKLAVLYDKPVLGLNAGRLGFLASLEPAELPSLLKLKDGFEAVPRMMLDIEHQTASGSQTYLAFNDAVLSKGAFSRIVDIEVSCNGKKMTTYRADGAIISTPTGSTGYALSAGGPIVDPFIDCIALTPISPHSLFNRTILLGDQNVLTVRSIGTNEDLLFLTVDGETGIPFSASDTLIVRKSKTYVRLVNLNGKQFYEVLLEKLLGRAHTVS